MTDFPVSDLRGYRAKTFSYKSTEHGDVKVDVAYPDDVRSSTRTVLLHYHGGFLVVGDRHAFFPYWLFNAGASRGWIFVTPDYRLMPESTAQSSLSDAIDAYEWVLSTLPTELGCELGPVLMAGSSAGGYLALATAVAVQRQPSALLLIYGMLDPTDSRYTTAGTNIFGQPTIETDAILQAYPMAKSGDTDTREAISAYQLPENPATDSRFGLVAALHVDALFLDYMTGIEGLGRSVASDGVVAIPTGHRNLFPLSFGDLTKLPKTMLLHGKIDSAVPISLSLHAAEKLRAAGVDVHTNFLDDAEHGFDARAGNVNIEAEDGEQILGYEGLREAIRFLDG